MSTGVKQVQILKAAQQLAMLATLMAKGLISEQTYEAIKASIYRDPMIVGTIK